MDRKRLNEAQKHAIEVVKAHFPQEPSSLLLTFCGISSSTLAALERRGLVTRLTYANGVHWSLSAAQEPADGR